MGPGPCPESAVRRWGTRGRGGALVAHPGALGQPELSFDDDAFAGLEALADDGALADHAGDLHRPHGSRHVGLHDIEIVAVLPHLEGGRRHGNRVLLGPQGRHDVHELARPQPAVGVGHRRLQRDRAGRGVDIVVDEGDDAGHGRARILRNGRLDADLSLVVGPADLRQVLLGGGERDVDRPDLGDGDKRAGVGRAHHVALLQGNCPGAAVDRRPDGHVAERQARILHGGLRRAHDRFLHGRRRLELVVALARHEVPLGKLGCAAHLGAGLLGLGTVAGEVRFHRTQGRLSAAPVQDEQHLACLHVLAFAEGHLGDLAVDARLHPDGGDGLDAADGRDLHRHVACLDRRHHHGLGPRLRRLRGSGRLGRRLKPGHLRYLGPPLISGDRRRDQEGQQEEAFH